MEGSAGGGQGGRPGGRLVRRAAVARSCGTILHRYAALAGLAMDSKLHSTARVAVEEPGSHERGLLRPTSLQRLAPVLSEPGKLHGARRSVFATNGGFRIFLDDACAMPADWRQRLHVATNITGKHINQGPIDDQKYGAESALPHMLRLSPFVTSDWTRANASLVVLYVHRYGGPIFGPERCRRALEERSPAWRATGGARHFFVLTSDFGPCDHSGHLLNPFLLRHHLIVTHGELAGHHWHWGEGPDLPCFDPHKDISIPPAIWVHALDEAPVDCSSPPRYTGRARNLLAFFAGAGEFRVGKRQGRQLMLRYWGADGVRQEPSILATWSLPREDMLLSMARSRFCPIFGGNSPWSTRLVEAMRAGCVPVFFSSWMPPFSRLIDWARCSVRIKSLDDVSRLKEILELQPYDALAQNVPHVLSAMWYRVGGRYRGDDMLPLLLVEMHLALVSAKERPLTKHAETSLGLPLGLAAFDDDLLAKRNSSEIVSKSLPPAVAIAVRRAARTFPPAYRGGVTIVTNRSERGETVWRCVPLSTNGHSYRDLDPWDIRGAPPGEVDTRLTQLQIANCVLVFPPAFVQSKGARAMLDPMSPTQVPRNYSLIRENREWLKKTMQRG